MAVNRKIEGARFVRYIAPVLNALRGLGDSGTPDEVFERVAKDLNISDDLQNELLPSGQSRFENQVAWARFYLVKAGLVDSSRRGIWSLTERGREANLTDEQSKEVFREVRRLEKQRKELQQDDEPEVGNFVDDTETEANFYKNEVINLLLSLSPSGFERLSQRMLREAGFTQVIVTGRSGDEGIDGYGTLQINPLLSSKVLFQCKRYKNSVSSPHVRDFRGAMAGRADKGIIITTGTFTADARREASRDGVAPIDLIDGDKLVTLLESLELGMKPVTTYEIDKSFFDEFIN